MTYIPYLGTFFFSRYPSVALARNTKRWRGRVMSWRNHVKNTAGTSNY